jgi:hypothetical protein
MHQVEGLAIATISVMTAAIWNYHRRWSIELTMRHIGHHHLPGQRYNGTTLSGKNSVYSGWPIVEARYQTQLML